MPIYDYECPKCKKIIEVYKSSWKDKSPVNCEKCNVECNKVISTKVSIGNDFKYGNMEFK